MRKWIASWLMLWARKINPDITVSFPMEFVSTVELADEIANRNDTAVIFWGRRSAEAQQYELYGECRVCIRECERLHVLKTIRLVMKEGATRD